MDVDSPGPRCIGRATRSFSFQHAINGFTLTELLAAAAVAIVLVGAALPSFRDAILTTRMSQHVNRVVGGLLLARNEAITRRRDMVACVSIDRSQCVRSGGWEQGWIIFEDRNKDRYRNDGEPILLASEALGADTTIRFRAFGSSYYLVYSPLGFTGSSNGTFTFCDNRGTAGARALIISKTGRVRQSRTQSDGTPLQCP